MSALLRRRGRMHRFLAMEPLALDLAGPLVFGAATGLRTTVPLALLAARSPSSGLPLQALLAAAAVGELVLDKLPTTPSRLLPPGLLGRVTAAAIGSAVLGRRTGRPLLSGVLGALGAVGGAVVGYSLRQRAQLDTGTPDLPWAVAEDGACLLLGWAATG